MKKLFIFILLPIKFIQPQTNPQLILNEIMFNPKETGNEFIELYNTTDGSIDLLNYTIIYQTSGADSIKSTGAGTLLQPASFAVILEGDYSLSEGIYKNLIPENALLLKIGDNSFGSGGMSNSSDRTLKLVNPENDTIQVYTYSADNSDGFSDEKILITGDNSGTNWTNSITINGTPGFRNSVTPLTFDLAIDEFTFSPEIPLENSDLTLKTKVKNIGISNSGNYRVNIYNDLNADSGGTASELIFTEQFQGLSVNDSNEVITVLNSLQAGVYNFISEIRFDDDEYTSNNKKFLQVNVLPPSNDFNDVVINEIMYDPKTGEPEWIEIFNTTSKEINLKNWEIADENNSEQLTDTNFFLAPNSFIVLTQDSTILNFYSITGNILFMDIPSLNNSGDNITIKDYLKSTIDNLNYLPSWGGNNGKSLERISQSVPTNNIDNWGTSKSKQTATPGKINSISQKDFDIELSQIIFTPEFPLIGDNVSFSVKVKNSGKNNAEFTIKLFEDVDLDSIADIFIKNSTAINLFPGDSSIIRMNYTINNLQSEKGFYAKAVFDSDQDTSNNYFYKKIKPGFPASSILINEIMYDPSPGEPEWIEFLNVSGGNINLKGWKIADFSSDSQTVVISDTDAFIEANEYFVIAEDSSFFESYSNPNFKVITADFHALENSGDQIIIYDFRNSIIDSLTYENSWGGGDGKSLERISIDFPANNSDNWGASKSTNGATPGKINSISQKDFDIELSDIIFTPEFPLIGADVSISVKIKNAGKKGANFLIKLFEDTDLDSIPDTFIMSSSGLNLSSGDSSIIPLDYTISSLQNDKGFYTEAVFAADQDTTNNYLYERIKPGFHTSSILINEIMYDPMPDQPEWMELINVSGKTINLKQLKVGDLSPTPEKVVISQKDFLIEPGQYLVIAKDSSFYKFYPDVESTVIISSFGALGNSEDGVLIYDFRNSVIDSLRYSSDWGGKNGFSLERISVSSPTTDSLNWITSIDENKSTPGRVNSSVNISSYDRNDIIINEIMFDPAESNSEFIEFLNISGKPINIAGWEIEAGDKDSYLLFETTFQLEANSFFILAADSSIFSEYDLENSIASIKNTGTLNLSNEGKLILLKDLKGNTIDSVLYSEGWHNSNFVDTKNISLEKINPLLEGSDKSNWSSSAENSGATPGKQNSIYTLNQNLTAAISISPNPFSPDDDGFEDFSIINYKLSQPTAQIRIKIFDSRGRLLRTLSNNKPSGSRGSIIFDGLDNSGNPLRMGIYIIYLEALNSSSGVVEALKKVVVIARRL